MSSRWSNRRRAPVTVLLLAATLAGCGEDTPKPAPPRQPPPVSTDPAQADADLLGREVYDIVDRVMAYRSAHRNRLPTSLRQAGLDSLTPMFVRRLGRDGGEPRVTIVFRRAEGHVVRGCAGTSLVLENSMLHDGAFDVECDLVAGGSRRFWVGGSP